MTRRKKITFLCLGLIFFMMSWWITSDAGQSRVRQVFFSHLLTSSSSTSAAKTQPPTTLSKINNETALPLGLSDIESRTGEGNEEAVLKNGVWFPVYAPDEKGSGKTLARVPLTITSSSPPPGVIGQAYDFTFRAIGGTPPYAWSVTGIKLPPEITIETATGRLFSPTAPLLHERPTIVVRDADSAIAAVVVPLIISPADPLTITTKAIPPAVVSESFRFTFSAQGGVPPYQWSVFCPDEDPDFHQSDDWQLVPDIPGEHLVTVTVSDAHNTIVEKKFPWTISEGLIITTTTPLPAARPGEAYQHTLQASGGTPPYEWLIEEGGDLTVDEDGTLSYQAPTEETTATLRVTVTDHDGLSFTKNMILPVRDRLLARASAEKIGLAWSPREITSDLAQRGESLITLTLQRADGVSYDALIQDHLVDRAGLVTGQSYRYDLIARTQGAEGERTYSYAHAVATLLPMTNQRAESGRTGDPYADRVVSFSPLSAGGFGAALVPQNVTGPPDPKATTYSPSSSPSELASLHAAKDIGGGTIVLEFTDNIVTLDHGLDLTVFENVFFVGNDPNKRFMEPAVISVALHEGEWHDFPTDVIPPPAEQPINFRNPFYYAEGFAGRNPTLGGDPTHPLTSGGDSFDLNALPAAAKLRWIRFIKIQSTGDGLRRDKNGDLIYHPNDPLLNPLSGTGSSGFDLDAVSAVNY